MQEGYILNLLKGSPLTSGIPGGGESQSESSAGKTKLSLTGFNS